MRQFFSIIIMIFTVIAVGARESLFIEDFTIETGETKTVEVLLQNDTTYCALQTDIVLPEGLTIELDGDEYVVDPTSRCINHAISSNLLASGALRVFVSSQSSRAFTGNSGAIVTFLIKAVPSFIQGNIELHNSMAVEADGTRHLLADATARVNGGSSSIIGDVDGNGLVNGSDVTALYNVLLNGAESAGEADVDGNGVVNGSDVTTLYNRLLQ